MNHASFGRIVLAAALSLRSVPQRPCQPYGRYDIHNYHKPWGKYGPTFSYPSLTKTMNVLNGRPANANRGMARKATPAPATRLSELNLLVSMPSGPWMKLDPKETGSRACYLISRNNPTMVISLAGERAGTEAGDTNSSLLAESQEKMKSLPGGTVEPGEQLLSAGGIQGVAYEATVVDGQFTAYYSMWVAAHNGYNYKLAVYGDQEDKPAIDEAMRNFVRGIKQIQSTRVARNNTNNSSMRRRAINLPSAVHFVDSHRRAPPKASGLRGFGREGRNSKWRQQDANGTFPGGASRVGLQINAID